MLTLESFDGSGGGLKPFRSIECKDDDDEDDDDEEGKEEDCWFKFFTACGKCGDAASAAGAGAGAAAAAADAAAAAAATDACFFGGITLKINARE